MRSPPTLQVTRINSRKRCEVLNDASLRCSRKGISSLCERHGSGHRSATPFLYVRCLRHHVALSTNVMEQTCH